MNENPRNDVNDNDDANHSDDVNGTDDVTSPDSPAGTDDAAGRGDAATPLDDTAPVTGLPYQPAPAARSSATEDEALDDAAVDATAADSPEPATSWLPNDAAEEPVSTSWRHPVNVGHLVMGVAFAGLVLVWALITSDAVADDEIRWLMPLPWVAAGALGLVATTWSNLRARKARELRY